MTGSARLPAATTATAAVPAARQERPTAAAQAATDAVPAARSTDPEARAASAAPAVPAPFVPRHRTRSSHP
ncbi:predicted protein [Streptomyces pristinaespiralis ATCC 25486]|uniref:Predicted protein n=2 Tax=Streptomyces pristinaespiralis TaxID=38300 RepID=D6X707_STRE2|nr:hypothetical protein SPRI_2861 [Streptomyces pristinaespiralis]EFH31099.1 predicted protein [Streptomyces pristinaespiralis ATCC 25486]